MAINIDISTYNYTVRPSYLYDAKHINDNFKNLGYNYLGKILKNTTSEELWANPMQTPLLAQAEALITQMFEETKEIKKTFAIAIDKKNRNIK